MSKQNFSDPITIRLPFDVLDEIDLIAQTTERSRSWIIVRALKSYLQNEGADILAYRQGMQDVANGEVSEMDDVLEDLERIVANKVA